MLRFIIIIGLGLFVGLLSFVASDGHASSPRGIDLGGEARLVFEAKPLGIHPIAKRSPFPAVGETLDKPISAKRLSDENQFAEPIDPANIPELVPWTQAKKYVGYEITVVGTIVDVGQSRNGKINFLNFHDDWRGKFYMVVFDDLAKTLPASVDATFRGKKLHVTGKVETHRGQPQIKIRSMDQVEFVGE